jgi:hypothetical protein
VVAKAAPPDAVAYHWIPVPDGAKLATVAFADVQKLCALAVGATGCVPLLTHVHEVVLNW